MPDARLVRDAGADALGVIFATSKRQVDVARARDIVVASEGLVRVGVFRDNAPAFVLDAAMGSGVDVVQIHGPLDDALLEQLRRQGLGVIKALAIASDDFSTFDDSRVDAVLVDGVEPGSGDAHSWEELSSRRFVVPIIAAGGLTVDNVANVIARVQPWGADVATGVESSPGEKDVELVTSFVNLARSAYVTTGAR